MTLVLTINGPGAIWTLADRRLSYPGKVKLDDATKMMVLDTIDGQAILAYAGLGATALGTQPADWMTAVLRGRNFTLEQSLAALAAAMKKELPPHLVRLQTQGPPSHVLLASAFVGGEHRLYSIEIIFGSDRRSYTFSWKQLALRVLANGKRVTPQFAFGGSGGQHLHRDRSWMRMLRQLVRTYDREQISAQTVADYLANLNYQTHLRIPDQSVGPRCIVVWRNVRDGPRRGGGAHLCYTDNTGETDSPALPSIVRGLDMRAMDSVMMPYFMQSMVGALDHGKVLDIDMESLNADLARLPETPDENLR